MVSACPETWGHGLEEATIEGHCADIDDLNNLPPVSDATTGRIYKNEYCAVCNSVMGIITWRYQMACGRNLETLAAQPGFAMTWEILEGECQLCRFLQPELFFNDSAAHACYPHVTSCLEHSELETVTDTSFNNVTYSNLVRQCTTNSGPYSLISTSIYTNGIPFRNQFCAKCNGANINGLSCYTPPKTGGTCQFSSPTWRPPTCIPPTTTRSPYTNISRTNWKSHRPHRPISDHTSAVPYDRHCRDATHLLQLGARH